MSNILPTHFVRSPLVVAIALLTGCGGSFNNPSSITAGYSQAVTPTAPTTTPAPTPPANPTDPLLQPTFGSFMPIAKRNLAVSANEDHKPLSPDDIKDADADTLTKLTEQLTATYAGKPVVQSDNSQYQFVKAGWIYSSLYPDEQEIVRDKGKVVSQYAKGAGYLYYLGEKPTTGYTRGTATYTGHWDFTTDVKRNRDKATDGSWRGGGSSYGMDNRFGDEIGASSFSEQYFGQYAPRKNNHIANFVADFDNKTLTGTLSTKQKKTASDSETTIDRYGINANITGNRFVGTATAKDSNSEFNLFSKNATNRLEGGFFGDNAEELAGKFLADDNSLFGVFAGKQTGTPAVLDKKYDGVFVEVTQDSDVNPLQQAQILSIPSFGNVNQLILNGKTIDLLPEEVSKATSQTVTLPSGQTAVITSFGTADGLLRLGSISKTALPPKSKEPSAQDIETAKATLKALVDEKVKVVDALIVAFSKATSDSERQTLTAQILEKGLVGYSDDTLKATAQKNIENSLESIVKTPRRLTTFKNAIIREVRKGDTFLLTKEENWKAYLPVVAPTLIGIDESLNSLYLIGERTALDKMPKSGEASYSGTWHGRIGQYWQSAGGYDKYDGKSAFLVDFGKKSLKGTLTEKSGIEPAFIITAKIDGNGFAGTATSRASGINLDPAKQQNPLILPTTVSNNLTGGFYGDNAKHLGGSFSFENTLQGTNDKVVGGAVFYGTKDGE